MAGLTPEHLRWAPAPAANSIGWLVWHLTRGQDHHIAELLGVQQLWASPEQAAAVRGLYQVHPHHGAAAGQRD